MSHYTSRKSNDTWFIQNPKNNSQILHEISKGCVEWYDSINPVHYFLNGKPKSSKPITYKTSRGALKFSEKCFPDANRHSATNLSALNERVDGDGKIWFYKGEWNGTEI